MKTLYLGLELPEHLDHETTVHCPFIRVIPRSKDEPDVAAALPNLKKSTHIIFTSRNAVSLFLDLVNKEEVAKKTLISVGRRTDAKLREYGLESDIVAAEETAEGVTEELKKFDLRQTHFFLPQSAISRNVIRYWLASQGIDHTVCVIYDTVSNLPDPLPNLDHFDRIIFTSPSVVKAFLQAYGSLPKGKELISQGPVTQHFLEMR